VLIDYFGIFWARVVESEVGLESFGLRTLF